MYIQCVYETGAESFRAAIAAARQNRQRGIFRKPMICAGKRAQHENGSLRGLYLSNVNARGAKPGAWWNALADWPLRFRVV